MNSSSWCAIELLVLFEFVMLLRNMGLLITCTKRCRFFGRLVVVDELAMWKEIRGLKNRTTFERSRLSCASGSNFSTLAS